MGSTFLTLALISFSCDLLRIIFQKLERPKEVQETDEETERQKRVIISTAISAYTGTEPDKISIRKISAETPEVLKDSDESESSPVEHKNIQNALRTSTSPWTLTGREELMKTRKSKLK